MKRLTSSLLTATAAIALSSSFAAASGPVFKYVPGSLVESRIDRGPWTLHEAAPYAHDASGIAPTTAGPPYAGSGTPYADFCAGGFHSVNHSRSLMQPYYFPFVRKRGDDLEGFFDYRPRNEQETVVAATSEDGGATWRFQGEALALNPYCPWDPTDPDNLAVSVGGVKTAYGSDPASAGDNGLGHPVVLRFGDDEYIYALNRANNHIDHDQLVVHKLHPRPFDPLHGLPAYGFVSPLGSGGYPSLETTALATTGLQNPDAVMGAAKIGGTWTVAYVEKTLNADLTFPPAEICPKTPAFALTTLVNHKKRKANDDVTTVRIATTTDGLNFTDVGAATGLNDPTTVALNGIRYLGSGSVIRAANGHFGMFFGAGNCLDNDSDGFHFIGYAETDAEVKTPSDLLAWHVVNGLDNPILSTDTVTDPAGPRAYPLNPPVVNATGADALTPAQVAPFTPPGPGYTTNYFSGRVYDPQPIVSGESELTIVFAGYNTPQPSNNLGDYRTIGRFKLRTPEGYFGRRDEDERERGER
jgi:hypothetical protein